MKKPFSTSTIIEGDDVCAVCGETACDCLAQYEQFMFDRPNVSDDGVENRFGLPAGELHRMYVEWQVVSGQNYASGNYL